MVKTLPSNAGGVGSTPVWGTKIPHASWPKKKKKQKKNKKKKKKKKKTESILLKIQERF